MTITKENIRILFGILILFIIFVFIGISSCAQRQNEIYDLIDCDNKFAGEAPNEFLKEVIDIKSIGGFDIKVSNNNKIVGFSMPVSAEKSFELIKNSLEEKKWICIDNGNNKCRTFTKDEGIYKWLFVNCVDVGGISSAIFTSE